MDNYPSSLINVIDHFRKLPGIGIKSAERIALHLLDTSLEDASKLSNSIVELKNRIRYCSQCFNFSEQSLCTICNNPGRDKTIICIVENPKDIQSIERTKGFKGLYHVLLGKISPLDGITPDKVKIRELIERVKKDTPQEIIIATSADVEGEATSLYLTKILKPFNINVTRIAYGIPVGSSIEFADEVTLIRAMSGRQAV